MDFNDRAGSNKRAGRNFHKTNLIEQASITDLKEFIPYDDTMIVKAMIREQKMIDFGVNLPSWQVRKRQY